VNGVSFIDYYDLMQISPNADDDTIKQMFRHLSKKCHPDYPHGNPEQFRLLLEAYETLMNPEKRAGYDRKYQSFWEAKWKLAANVSGGSGLTDDRDVRERLLSLYYVQRRSKLREPGLGEMEVARLMRIPIELIEFHVWYLKEKGWISRLDNGMLAITASGVDEAEKDRLRISPDRLLTAKNSHQDGNEDKTDLEPVPILPAGGGDGR
jgi:curved DNA-binding protein